MLTGIAEPRYNFATKIMSNGVEVIVAGDRNSRPAGSDYLRLLSTATRPITLAPHTLSHHMSMVLPTGNGEETGNHLLSSLNPHLQFTTKTYYTTYTYLTTLKEDGGEVSSTKTTVSNIQTEEISKNIKPTATEQITLTNSPELQTGVYKTTYTYLNTILDGEQPLVMTSKHTVANTVVGVEDFMNEIEPSEQFPTTNTYLKTFELTKTLTDGTDFQVVSTQDVLTQVVITDKPEVETVNHKPQSVTEVIKTYFVTYTYFTTLVENEETKVKSDVSVSSDVVTEKFLIKPKKTQTVAEELTPTPTLPSMSILATKTYKTTFTFFTTLKDDVNKTKVNSRTKIVQNIVTETLNPQDLNADYVKELDNMLNKKPNKPIVTTATLKDGAKLEITALKERPGDNQIVASALLAPSEEAEIEDVKNKMKNTSVKPTTTIKVKTTLKNKLASMKVRNKTSSVVSKTEVIESTQDVTPTLLPTELSNHNMNNTQTTPVSYSTLVLATSTVTESGTTLLPGEQVIVLENQNGGVTLIPVSDPAKKKQQIKTPSNEIQVSDILSLGSLGINSINVLAPVFNAMAGLIQNNLKHNEASRRNDTVPIKKPQVPVKKPYNKNPNPILDFVAGLKPPTTTTTEDPRSRQTTPRIPVYIPVGSFAQALRRVDNAGFENSDVWGKERTPDKWHSEGNRRVSVQVTDNSKKKPLPILESGIPISPGQVITTNSDVIIGRPGLLGPRPPPSAVKNNIPLDMKPPPTHRDEEEPKVQHDTVGQHSTLGNVGYGGKNQIKNDDIDMVPPPPPSRPHTHHPHHHHHPHPSKPFHHVAPHVHVHHKHKPTEGQPPKKHDSGDIDLNPPPPPPPIKHRPEIHKPHTIPRPFKHKETNNIVPIPVHLGPEANVENYVNPVRQDSLGLHNIPVNVKDLSLNRPTPSIHYINPNGIQVVPSVSNEPVSLIVSHSPHVIERSTGQPLLVNIQPSQVANVVIPHGSSTALIISGEKQHSTKGEVIDDPKPHPEPETVGFVGAEPVLKMENGDVSSVRKDVIPVKGVGEVGRPELVGGVPHGVRYDYEPPQLTIGAGIPDPTFTSQYDDIGLVPPVEPAFVGNYHYHGLPHYIPNQVPVVYAPAVGYGLPVHGGENAVNPGVSVPNGGINVDVSPPGHLPPSNLVPNLNIHHTDNVQSNLNENLANHQSGLVHDVPLNAQVQLGSGQTKEPAVQEVLVNINPNQHGHDDVQDQTQLPSEISHQQPPRNEVVKIPTDYVPDNMSPPPPPPDKRPPSQPSSHGPGSSQRYPVPHSSQKFPVDELVDFMKPPPHPKQPYGGPYYRPNVEHKKPVQPSAGPIMIPVGANANKRYPKPKPEDLVIIPNRVHPSVDGLHHATNEINYVPDDKLHVASGNVTYPNIDYSEESSAPADGEIQETNTFVVRPNEVFHNQTQHMSDKNFNLGSNVHGLDVSSQQSNIGLSQTLSFASQDEKPDKTKFENAETIIGSKLPNAGFNNNEAIVSIGSRPMITVEKDEQVPDPPKKIYPSVLEYGMKLNNKKEDSQPAEGNKVEQATVGETKKGGLDSMDDILTPPKIPEQKPEEVMGLSPPPLVERPRPRPLSRPVTPYKFVVPTTPKTTYPLDIENDFPPVRTPDINKKPAKKPDPPRDHFTPEVDFPPVRTPDYVSPHSRPDTSFPSRAPDKKYPQRKPDRPPVTSLHIDVPQSSTTENIVDLVPPDEDSREKYFTNNFDTPNGHSKPILKDPLPPPPTSRPPVRQKPVVYERPPAVHQQKPVTKPDKVERPRPSGFTIRKPENIEPTSVNKYEPTKTDWRENDVVIGSETIFDTNMLDMMMTPTFEATKTKTNIKTSVISSGSTTIFGDLYTDPILIQPTKITTIGPRVTYGIGSKYDEGSQNQSSVVVVATKPILPTHTTTLTVTTTLKTIIHNSGHKPSTKTIVLTKTLISTIVDKITETQTLVKPTTSTVTQTHTISTTKTALVVPTAIYPPNTKYPTKTLKPEIFVADPHDHMTISVSSSMSKDHKVKNETKVPDVKPTNDESIFVVINDKRPFNSSVDHFDVNTDDTVNDLNDSGLMLGGVLVANNPIKNFKDIIRQNECLPECKASRNELCQKLDGTMRCVCRPGFARMFLDRPCKPTYTYNMKLTLDRQGSDKILFDNNLSDATSPMFVQLSGAAKEGLDRMVMQSDLRDIYHGIAVNSFQEKEKQAMVDFYVQLSENTDEKRLMDVFNKSLRTSNYSLGGTEMFAAREADNIETHDFNECKSRKFHDCSEQAHCYNLKGTYTCSCKEGYTDLSENPVFPGRVCSAEMIGCDYCNYHGTCYTREEQVTCECFQWYTGDRCHINLKVLLIALVTIGAILLTLLLVCFILTCLKRRSRSTNASRTNGSSGYLRYRGPPSHKQPLDKRAMIPDTSSESSVENVPYTSPPQPSGTLSAKRKSAMRPNVKGPAPRPGEPVNPEHRDRSIAVMIPRAKYRPVPPISPHLTMSTFAPDKNLQRTSAQIASEQKLLNYLEGAAREGQTRHQKDSTSSQQPPPPPPQSKMYEYKNPNNNLNAAANRRRDMKKESRTYEYEYKTSNMNITDGNSSGDRRSDKREDSAGRARRHSDSAHMIADVAADHRGFQHRKYSAGALVSAGYEVSATVGVRQDADMFDDDTSGIAQSNTLKSGRSQFTTLNRTGDHKTMSEARSYDETTIHPPTRTLKTHYSGSSPSSRINNEEGHTMVERDLGSTFMMPEPHLFKPDRDRGSDISNFDSL